MLQRETARYHTVVHTLIRRACSPDIKLYVLYLLSEEGAPPKPMQALIEYVLEHGRTRSLAWQREVTRSVGLFVDYLKAHEVRLSQTPDRPQVLAEFAEALVGGTISKDGTDYSGLYWEPKSPSRVTVQLSAVTNFSDWLVKRYDTTPINPWREATVAEQMTYWRRFDKRRASSMLAHTFNPENEAMDSRNTRTVKVLRKSISHDIALAKHFPEVSIWRLLSEGFQYRGKAKAFHIHERMNIRDMMITILLHAGGLRESEPFHLYISDVLIDPRNPQSAIVRLYHPERGVAPDDYVDPIINKPIKCSREQYLRTKWGLEPRNLVHGRYHAGWKDLKMTNGKENYALVHWFPSYWGEVFLALFKVYITKLRSRHANHPYLFVSLKDSVSGDPYTIDSFRQSHAKAVKRIDLPCGKNYGTTPHGHRHAYAQRLTDAGVKGEVIQAALHHKSPESQQVYKEPTAEMVNKALASAGAVMRPPHDVFEQWV